MLRFRISKQMMPLIELKRQEQELWSYMKTPGHKQSLPSHQDEAIKKLIQIKDAEKYDGELDPAVRLNPRYGNANRTGI